jgi:hypothetical protein
MSNEQALWRIIMQHHNACCRTPMIECRRMERMHGA